MDLRYLERQVIILDNLASLFSVSPARQGPTQEPRMQRGGIYLCLVHVFLQPFCIQTLDTLEALRSTHFSKP